MASSGNYSVNFYMHDGYWAFTLTLEWNAVQDIPNNRSTLYARMHITSSPNKNIPIAAGTYRQVGIGIENSSGLYIGYNQDVSVAGGHSKQIWQAQRTIYHSADGTAKNVWLSGSIYLNYQFPYEFIGTVGFPDYYLTLDPIPRASSITVPNFTIGNDFTVSISRASSTFKHYLDLRCNYVTIRSVSNVDTSYKFSLTEAEQNIIYTAAANSTTIPVTVTCQTKDGSGNNVGSPVSKNVIASVPTSVVPTIGSVTASEYVADVASKVGGLVQELSRLNMAIVGAAGAKYSTIKSYKITFEGVSHLAQTAVSSLIAGSGSLTVSGTVTDSRGRTATKNLVVTVLPYAPPEITVFTLARCKSNGVTDPMGEYVKATIAGKVSSLKVGGTEKNTLSYAFKSKKRTDTTWDSKYSNTGPLLLSTSEVIGTYSNLLGYDFRFDLTDKFSTTISLNVVAAGRVTMSWDKDGVGIGKVRTQGALDVDGDVFVDGDINATGGITAGGDPLVYFADYEDW